MSLTQLVEWVKSVPSGLPEEMRPMAESICEAFQSTAKRLMDLNLALPAYEMVLKAGHTFNLLDAHGAISVTERAAYIARIRNISRSVAQSYYDSRERLGFPMLKKAH